MLITQVSIFPKQVGITNKKLGKKLDKKWKTNRRMSQYKRLRFIIKHEISSKMIHIMLGSESILLSSMPWFFNSRLLDIYEARFLHLHKAFPSKKFLQGGLAKEVCIQVMYFIWDHERSLFSSICCSIAYEFRIMGIDFFFLFGGNSF